MINLNFSSITIEDALSILKHVDEKWVRAYYEFLNEYFTRNEIKVRTSGTTGKRKVITVSKLQMQKSADATLKYFNLKKGNSTLLALSCDFIAGKMMLVRAIEGKLNLFLAKPCSNPSNYFSKEYDFVPLVPMQVQNIIKTKKVNQIKKLLVGGGKLSDDMVSQLNKFKTQSYESFAMTETLTHFAIKQIAPVYNEWFKTIKGFEIDHNKEGELIIKKNIITNCELETKDLIEKKSNSEFKWLGRSDNIVNSGGKRIRPLLTIACSKLCGYSGSRHILHAAVIEFIHTATLLHDDVVDKSDLRRGRKTTNAVWGNPASVLVGDFLYSRAFEMMVAVNRMPIMQIMAATTNRISEGEVLQLQHMFLLKVLDILQ